MAEETKLQPADNSTPEEFLLQVMPTLPPEVQAAIKMVLCKLDKANEQIENLQKDLDLKKKTGNFKHGMARTKIYAIWRGIKSRCFYPTSKCYHDYGGRGITLYPAWVHDFQSFYDYVSKLEHYGEKGYSLDRIDNDKNYEPGNLRWADNKTQSRNRRSNHLIEYQGQKMTIAEAAEKSGIKLKNLYDRLYRGDTGERLFRPVKKQKLKLI